MRTGLGRHFLRVSRLHSFTHLTLLFLKVFHNASILHSKVFADAWYLYAPGLIAPQKQ